MRVSRSIRRTGAAPLLSALLVVVASPVLAAPEFVDATVRAGLGRQVVTIRNMFGCSGQATDWFEVEVPEGVVDVTPKADPGWTIETQIVPSAPYELFGTTHTERVGTVRWIGSVPADQFAEFSFMAVFGDEPGQYTFPVIQGCSTGKDIFWTEVPMDGQGPSDLTHPAPVLDVVEPAPEIDVVALRATVSQLEEQVAGLEESLGEVATSAGDVKVPALRKRVTDLEDAITELRQRVDALDAG